MEEQGNSPSSSIDSSSSSTSFSQPKRRDLTTDLGLGLSLSTSSPDHDSSSNSRQKLSDWPPIKPLQRSMLRGRAKFIKVYMEGVLVGRKLDLFALDGYERLIVTLQGMFQTAIMYPEVSQAASSKAHVLIYEDHEGDWMMVGDVPWEMFLTTIKRLKITRAGDC